MRQFNWRRRWSKDIAPHLKDRLVQTMLNFGMTVYEGKMWKPGDPPYLIGGIGGHRIIKNKLSWYQPLGRCHYIAPFVWAIGKKAFPDLDWKCFTSDRHTVVVGFKGGEKHLVMDILLFEDYTAEESLDHVDDKKTQYWCDNPLNIFCRGGI